MTSEDPLLWLREHLAKAPSHGSWKHWKNRELWRDVLNYFEAWPEGQEAERAVAMDYACGHIDSWPPEHRAMKGLQPAHPGWRLVGKVIVEGCRKIDSSYKPIEATEEDLHEERQRLAALADLDQHPHIKELQLMNFHALDGAAALAELQHLRSLKLSTCCAHGSLPHLPWLRELSITSVPSGSLDNLYHLNSQLISLSLESADSPAGQYRFSALTSLERLELRSYKLQALSSLAPLSQLQELRLEATGLTHIDGLKKLPGLRVLHLKDAWRLATLDGIEACTGLQELSLRGCRGLRSIWPLRGLNELRSLDLHNCNELRSLKGLSSLSELAKLDLSKWNSEVEGYCPDYYPWRDLQPLAGLAKLERLNLMRCKELTSLQGLEGAQQLRVLELGACRKLEDIAALKGLGSLEVLNLNGTAIASVKPLTGLSGLRELSLYLEDAPELSWVASLPQLSILRATCDGRTSGQISGPASLTELHLSGPYHGISHKPVAPDTFASLPHLEVLECHRLKLAGIWDQAHSFGALRKLRLDGVSGLASLELSGMPLLRELLLTECATLREVLGLEALEQLQLLSMARCRDLQKAPGLKSLPRLERLNITGCRSLPYSERSWTNTRQEVEGYIQSMG